MLARRYGPYAIGVFALIVAAVGGREFMTWRSHNVADRDSQAYVAAMRLMETGDLAAARERFAAVAEDATRGYEALAKMQEGAIALEEGDQPGAVRAFDAAATRAKDPLIADLAALKAVYALADTASYPELLARLDPLSQGERPYRFAAKELIGAKALEAGDLDRAREEYTYLSLAPDTPSGVRERAGQALALLDARTPREVPGEEEQGT